MNSERERVERRLAAILAADVAGYSRLMGADEEGTLGALKAIRRELGDPKVKEHRGRIVKTTFTSIPRSRAGSWWRGTKPCRSALPEPSRGPPAGLVEKRGSR